MRSRLLGRLVIVGGWGTFAACVAWPLIALLVGGLEVLGERGEAGEQVVSVRRLALLWRSAWLAGIAASASVGLAGVILFARATGGAVLRTPLLTAALAACLLCPPMVYSFAWERLLPIWVPPTARCVGVWALSSWAIPALLLDVGWSRGVGRGYEAALLSTTSWGAIRRVAMPMLRPYWLCGWLVVFVLCFNDYGVPHACGMSVYATELLSLAQASGPTIATSLPPLLVTALLLVAVFWSWQRCPAAESDGLMSCAVGVRWWAHAMPLWLLVTISWVIPMGALVARLGSWPTMREAIGTYAGDLGWSIGVVAVGGAAAVIMGLAMSSSKRWRELALACSVLLGVLPGALTGEALVRAFDHASLAAFYDRWPILSISYVARFGWIGVLAARLVMERTPPAILEAARLDRADRGTILWTFYAKAHAPALFIAWFVIAALSLAEVAASSLVRVPDFNPVAHVLIEKFHRFEDGMLVSLSLWLVAATLPAVVLLAWASRRR